MSELKKGIVMEADSGAVTVLTSQGEFLSIPWLKKTLPEIGSEVEFTLPWIERGVFQHRLFIALAAGLILFILTVPVLSGLLFPGSGQIVAFVSVDINPSIEFGINEKGRVLAVEGLNEDGIKLLENLKLINIEITEAVEMVTSEAIKREYLNKAKENNVVIAVSNPDKVPEKVKSLDNSIKEVLKKEKIQVEASLIEVSGDIHDKAKAYGVSTGKYVILMVAAEEENLQMSLEDIKGNSIVKAIKDAGGIPGQLISKAKGHKSDFEDIQNRFEEKEKYRKQSIKAPANNNPGPKENTQAKDKKPSDDNNTADKNDKEDREIESDKEKNEDKEKNKEKEKNEEKETEQADKIDKKSVESPKKQEKEDDKESGRGKEKDEEKAEEKENRGNSNSPGKRTTGGGKNALIIKLREFLQTSLT